MSQLKLYLLGPARIERNGQAVEVETRKAIGLLAYLALHPERLSRDQLAALFWPEYDPERAYANLRRTLWALNKALGDGWLTADNLSLELRQQDGLWVDVLEFQRLLAQCRTHGHRSDEVCAACLAPLGQAVKLARGDFLEGFSLRDSAAFDDWHFFEAESLRKALATSLEKLVRGHSVQQEDEIAIGYARRWLALDPLHEPPHRWLMQLYAWTGQPATAARQYQECVRVLKAELDAPPEAETTALYNRIRAKQVDPRPAKPPPAPITPPPPAPPVPASPTPPVQELPPAIAPVAEDELRMVTVLCIGLAEPFASEQAYPTERAAQRVKQFLQMAETILQRYEGRVERWLGEGVVALFGAQQLHEDDPERAVRAALELQQAAQAQRLAVSAGLNSGHVYLSSRGANITALGPVINLALRLQAKADPGQLLMGEATYRQTRGVVVCTPLPWESKGTMAPLQVYQIERLQPHPQKARGIAGLHAPLVGRSKELATLQEALATIQSGEGQLITLIGDAGVGKSRLVSELKWGMRNAEFGIELPAHSALRIPHSALLWLEGRCLEMSMSASYWPFLDILRAHLDWQPEEAEASRAGRIVTALDALMDRGNLTTEQREEMGPLLGNLLAVRFSNDWDERLKFAGPEQMRHQTLVALRDFFIALCRQGPVVLVLEDLHWADSLSLDLITLLMKVLAQQPLLLLCVYRPEQQHRCWQLATLAMAKCPDNFAEVRLRELSARQSQQLVEALLTIENLTPKVKATILEKAQGNPLFVEEVIRSLIDAGIVYRQGEVWQALAEIENIVVPETVQSVILSRVDRLGEALKGLLQRAAVIGRVFGRRLLAQLAPPGLDLDNAVLALTNHALIYQERVVPEEEYSFKHVLVQEAIYQTTLAERREQYHRQVGEAMERLYSDNLAERYEQLAYHYDRSGVVSKAIEYLLKAGEKARRAYLYDEAIGYFQRVLEWLDGTSTTEIASLEERLKDWWVAALKGLGQIYLHTGHNDKAEASLRQAIDLGQQSGLPIRELIRLYYWLGEILWWQGRYAERIAVAEAGLALLGSDLESVEAAMMNSLAAWGHYMLENVNQARQLTLRNAQFIPHLPYVEELRPAYGHIVIVYRVFEHDIEQVFQWLEVMRRVGEENHDLHLLAAAHHNRGITLWRLGKTREAIQDLQQGQFLHNKIGDINDECECLNGLGLTFLALGDLKNAEDFALKMLNLAESASINMYIRQVCSLLCAIYRCQGLWEKAVMVCERAIQVCQQTHNHWSESWFVFCLGEVYLAQTKSVKALELLQKALLILTEPDVQKERGFDYNLLCILAALEAAYQDPNAFFADCARLRQEHPELVSRTFVQWFLAPSQLDFRFAILDFALDRNEIQNLKTLIKNVEWTWHDPFEDSSFTLDNRLEIHATNGRDIFGINLSAPRFLRSSTGDSAVQTICVPVSDEKPVMGGILFWKDERNYLRLDRGVFRKHEITFSGFLDNNQVIIGRGRLPAERVFLRLERIGERVNALCSADGEAWFTVGHVDFPVADPVQVGMHAIGMIERLIYPGAYPDGTAIRFEAFTLYRG